jgi:hypothetical protein
VRLVFLDSLNSRYPGAINHGYHVDIRTMRGDAAVYSPADPNCCPSRVAEMRLRLRGNALEIVEVHTRPTTARLAAPRAAPARPMIVPSETNPSRSPVASHWTRALTQPIHHQDAHRLPLPLADCCASRSVTTRVCFSARETHKVVARAFGGGLIPDRPQCVHALHALPLTSRGNAT